MITKVSKTLSVKVDIFLRKVCEICTEYFCSFRANSKLQSAKFVPKITFNVWNTPRRESASVR